MSIEVACDMPGGVELVVCELEPGSRVIDVLERMRLQLRDSQTQWPPLAVGVHGRIVDLNRIVQPGDRVEIYRPLQADPKLARRQRVKRERRLPKPPTR